MKETARQAACSDEDDVVDGSPAFVERRKRVSGIFGRFESDVRTEPSSADGTLPTKYDALQSKYDALQSKYDALARKYSRSIEELGEKRGRHIEFHRLMDSVILPSSGGWALLREDGVDLTNLAFDRLDLPAAIGACWRRTEDDAESVEAKGTSYRSLRAVALELAALLRRGAASPRTARLACSGRVIELTVWRSPRGRDAHGALAIARDMTNLAEAEAELASLRTKMDEQAGLRALGEQTAGVAHDLTNLLSALGLRLAVLQCDPDLRGRDPSDLNVMDRIIATGRALTRELQSSARPVEGDGTADLGEVIRSAIEIVESGRPTTDDLDRIRILADLPNPGSVAGRADDLCSVFINLLLNARDAMPHGGVVTIAARTDGRETVVSVEDEGAGIPAEVLPRLFEPFFTTKGSNGTGLGLAMAKRAMARCGGTISARNRRQQGAAFELRFVAR
jgi:signal transduction histidine kinase